MRKDNGLPSQPKGSYRAKNWPEYNAGLIERGNVSTRLDEAMFAAPPETSGRRGRPQSCCDAVIQMLLTLKSVYRLPLVALQGLAMRLQCLARANERCASTAMPSAAAGANSSGNAG